MLCPKCGFQNKTDTKYCENCGTALEKGKRNNRDDERAISWYTVTFTALFILIPFILIFFGTGKSLLNYKKTAAKYVRTVQSGDWNRAYKLLELPKDPFLTQEAYNYANSIQEDRQDVVSVEMNDSAFEEPDDDVKEVVVQYELSNGASDVTNITLKKVSSNYLLFFKKYKVDIKEAAVTDVMVKVPHQMKLSINGTEVTEQYLNPKEDDSILGAYDYYTIPYLFKGYNVFKVSGLLVDDYAMVENVQYDNQGVELNATNLVLSESTVIQLEEQAQIDYERIIAAGVLRRDFLEIKDLVISSATAAVKKYYDENVVKTYETEAEDESVNHDAEAYQYKEVKAHIPKDKLQINIRDQKAYVKVYITQKEPVSFIQYKYDDGRWLIESMELHYDL